MFTLNYVHRFKSQLNFNHSVARSGGKTWHNKTINLAKLEWNKENMYDFNKILLDITKKCSNMFILFQF